MTRATSRRGAAPAGWAWLALFLLFTATAFEAAAQSPCALEFPHDSNPTAITDQDICNFHQVDPQWYRGGRPQRDAFPKLRQLGIRTIINLEESEHAEEERALVERLNATSKREDRMDFITFPITQEQISDFGISDAQVRHLFQLIQDARKPIFIHCYYGRDRTGLVVALYRMASEGVPYAKAYEEALHYKFSPEDFGLKRTLDRYKNPRKLNSLGAR